MIQLLMIIFAQATAEQPPIAPPDPGVREKIPQVNRYKPEVAARRQPNFRVSIFLR